MKWMLLPAGIFTADYIMKKRAESWNEEEAPEKMLGGHIILQKLHNRGAALSFMEKTPKLLTGVTTVVTAGMTAFYVYLIKKPKQLFLKTGVGMILGGYNKQHNPQKALATLEKAYNLDTTDARILIDRKSTRLNSSH